MLYRIVYISTAAANFQLRSMPKLLKDARDRNFKSALSGLLIFVDGSFMQVLEGTQENVQDCYGRITRDPRHSNLQVIFSEPIRRRAFPGWSMAWHNCPPGGEVTGLIRSFQDQDSLEKLTICNAVDLEEVLNAFARSKFTDAA